MGDVCMINHQQASCDDFACGMDHIDMRHMQFSHANASSNSSTSTQPIEIRLNARATQAGLHTPPPWDFNGQTNHGTRRQMALTV